MTSHSAEVPPSTARSLPVDARHRVKRIRRIARLLDDSFRVPGTNARFGLDGLIGLIPGVGDLATAAVSLYLIHEARQLGVPKATLLRMVAHSGLDLAIGALPLVGDLADFVMKPNRRNVRLLEEHIRRLDQAHTLHGR